MRDTFSDEQFAKDVEFFVPVLIDGDVDKGALKKYGIRGYPTVKFLTPGGEVIGDMGMKRDPAQLGPYAKSLLKKNPPRFTKAYKKLLKARIQMDQSFAKKDYAEALEKIEKLSKAKHHGLDYMHAQKVKQQIAEIAKKKLADIKAESSSSKALRELKGFKKDFDGLDDMIQEAEELEKKLKTKEG